MKVECPKCGAQSVDDFPELSPVIQSLLSPRARLVASLRCANLHRFMVIATHDGAILPKQFID